MDIFDLCDCLEDDSIDMILCDLPYGITACEWDNVIPFEPMWECFKRVIKPRGAVVLTASGKFTYKLVMSNFEWFKYEWVWDKVRHTNFLNGKNEPLKHHEIVLLFGDASINYYPQMVQRVDANRTKYKRIWSKYNIPNGGAVYGGKFSERVDPYRNTDQRFPGSIIYIQREIGNNQHPTQKPVALFEYLIRTYTQPGAVVFDPCVGSGTTAIAARNTGRNFICGDSSAEYVQVARDRLAQPYTLPMFDETTTEDEKPQQTEMELK